VVSGYVPSRGGITPRGSGTDQRRQFGTLEDANPLASQPAGRELAGTLAPDYAVNVAGLRPGRTILE
jgi:hypothetical protein